MVSEVIYLEYLSCLLEGDKEKCSAIIAHLLEQKTDIKELYTRVFKKSLYHVGKLWEMNKICVATEHLATSITECLMNFTYPVICEKERCSKKAVVSCVSKEFHQVGAKMASDIFELNGWNSYFLGANTPPGELFKLINEKQPDILGISVGFYMNIVRLADLIEKVQSKYPSLEIIVGGQAFEKNGTELLQQFSNVTYIPNLNVLEKHIRNFSVEKNVDDEIGKHY